MTKLRNDILWIAIMLTSLGISMMSGCSPNISETESSNLNPLNTSVISQNINLTSATPVIPQTASGITPTPIPPPLTRDANNPEYYYVDKVNLENMGMTPRDLTQAENETLIRIALNVDPVREKIEQGMRNRTKIVWARYMDSVIGWGYSNYDTKDKLAQYSSKFKFVPAVEMGLGTPQQYKAYIVVDLVSEKAVYAAIIPDEHNKAPDYVRPLTEVEKTKLITIASESDDVKRLNSENYNIDLQWVAISGDGGIKSSINYEAFEEGIPAYIPIDKESMTVFPAVQFMSSNWMVSIAVDLKTGKIVNTFAHPLR